MPQTLSVKTAAHPAKKTEILVLYVGEGLKLGPEAEKLVKAGGLDLKKLAKAAKFNGKPSETMGVLAPEGIDADRIVMLGYGKHDTDLKTARARGGQLVTILEALKAEKAAIILDTPDTDPAYVGRLAEALKLRHYKFDKYRAGKDKGDNGNDAPKPPAKLTVTLCVDDKRAVDKAVADRDAVAEGIILARNLVNEPPNVLGPVEFAGVANRLSDFGLEVEVLTDEQMRELGMGALLAVAQGSERPGRLAIMQWKGGKKGAAPVCFVGKGVVFDTGGISIKPGAGMEDMKGDMGGAAAVAGVMKTLALRKAKVNAVGVIGLVENMPDGKSYRPGDIITSMSGQTIEVVNTDAEGRLVLCDALHYVQDRFKPEVVIDLATLTGAVLVALGQEYAGLFTDDDGLATALSEAGETSGDKVWRQPLHKNYDKMIDSKFADMKNVGGRYAGSITAAQFLKRFINKDQSWAHLDIAGTGFGAGENDTNRSWGTGFGVALLDQLVRDRAEK
ncbi:leucyl aminopeptidase [Cucumibacter marinus]|uniref:leucyl aminopeptidase n=1 Tax=Cucumibacter marinus TaxID=1121252 RepID=UPI0004045785|nr:leucyl aminopeptidase [Cucumibacter marinus]